jgi:hypothetical protein
MRERRGAQGFGEETGGKEPLGRPRRRWDDNIEIDFRDVGLRERI